MSPGPRRERLADAPILAGAFVAALLLVVPRMSQPISFDGAQTYLPWAAQLLRDGAAFLATERSVMVAPLAYAYPALLGASELAVRWANVALFLLAIWMAYGAARIAHSRTAGLAAALLLAVSPTLRPYVADVITEPPFVFLVVMWAACVARLGVVPRAGTGWLAAGAIALGAAALTRPSVMLFAPAMAAWFGLRAWRGADEGRATDARLAAMHAAAMLLPLAWIARNYLLFGLASIATGSGAALWLGIDPLVYGFDPVYFGMDYDAGGVARDMSHLSLEGDRTLRAVAAVQLHDIPWTVLAEMGLRKAAAFLVFSGVESGAGLLLQREWRILLLVLVAVALAGTWRSRFTQAMALLAAYMVAIHLPAMYHHRYSVGAIDPPLTLLAAVGVALCLGSPLRMAVALFGTAILGAAGALQLASAGPGSPRVDRVPGQLVWSEEVKKLPVLSTAAGHEPGTARFDLTPAAAIEIPVHGTQAFLPGDYSAAIIGIAIAPQRGHAGCEAMRLRYREEGATAFDPARVVRIPLQSDGSMRALVIGTTQPLHLNRDGVLRLEFECAGPATAELGRITLVAPRRSLVYRERWLAADKEAR